MQNENIFTRAKEILYGSKTKEEKENNNLRNSLLNQLGNKIEPKHVLYSSNDNLKKMVNNQQQYMTPIKDLKSRQEYLRQGMCKVNEKMTPGINACSSDIDFKIDNRNMRPETLAKLREFIGVEENFKPNAYQDGGGIWTIGYGHTKNVKPGDKITREQAQKMFEEDIKEHIDSLKHVKTKLSENQKAALGSLIFNTGGTKFYRSDMLKKLNANDIKGAADEFDLFVHDAKGNVEKGLVNRRKKEKEWFLRPDEY